MAQLSEFNQNPSAKQEAKAPDKKFVQFLNEAAQLDRNDSYVESDEYQYGDEVAALPSLAPAARPAGLGSPLSIIFLLDVSRSMERTEMLQPISLAVAGLMLRSQH
eukprot:2277859-Amphidinium_carterae.2